MTITALLFGAIRGSGSFPRPLTLDVGFGIAALIEPQSVLGLVIGYREAKVFVLHIVAILLFGCQSNFFFYIALVDPFRRVVQNTGHDSLRYHVPSCH